MSKASSTQAHISLIIANLLFGINFSVVKVISPDLILPLGLNMARVLGATSLFWMLFLFRRKKGWILRKDIPRFIICAITGVAINQILFIKGIVLTTPIHASLLILGTPVFILILSFITRAEALSLLKITGLLIALTGGILLVITKESSTLGSNILMGDIFVLINAISYAIYMILVKPLTQSYTPIQITRNIFTIGLFIMLPFCWKDFSATQWNTFTPYSWGALSLVVIGATFLAYLFIAYGIHHLSPSVAGAYIYTQPVFTACIAIIFLHEDPALYKLVAALLIFSGVYMINKKKYQIK